MLVKSFVSNIIIDTIINNYTIWISIHRVKLFEVGCLHQYTVTALYRVDRMKSCSKFLRILVSTVYFTERNWVFKFL